MKKNIAIGIGVLLLIVALFFAVKPSSFSSRASKVLSKLNSYQLEGNMEISSGDDIRSYLITSSWQKVGEQEYFKVSMLDKSLNQEQVILKNTEGVFVITPSLNQVFKFQGEWPMNSPKPYLLQTMMELLKSDHKIEKESDGYLISAPAAYPSAATLVTQDIKFNKEVKPVYLIAYNDQQVVELKMEFSKVEYNPPFETDFFATPNASIEAPTSSYEGLIDLPLYPVSVFDSKLTSNTVANINGENQHILQFVGNKDFTVVQTEKKASSELKIIPIDGKLVEGLGLIGYYEGNKLTIINSQIEYSIYSEDLSEAEMMQVVESMQVSVMK